MEKYFNTSAVSLLGIGLSAIGMYFAVVILTNLAGKRSFSKMSSFDFAMTISIGAIIATTILSPTVDLLQGITGLTVIFLLELLSNFLRERFTFYRKAVDNKPLLLMEGSTILKENLIKVRLTEGDIRAHLRRANVLSLSQVKAVVFENTGEISVLKTGNKEEQLQDYLLIDVRR